jgi:hypothetical protein
VCLVAAAETLMLYVLLLVLLVQWLLLLWYWAREMCEGVREVVTGETAPVRRHCEAGLGVATIRVCVDEGVSVILRAADRIIYLVGCADEARESSKVSLGYADASRVVITMGCGRCVNGVGRATAVDDVWRPCV